MGRSRVRCQDTAGPEGRSLRVEDGGGPPRVQGGLESARRVRSGTARRAALAAAGRRGHAGHHAGGVRLAVQRERACPSGAGVKRVWRPPRLARDT